MRLTKLIPVAAAVAATVLLVQSPRPLLAQSKEIVQLQRDIYDVLRKLDEVKTGQSAQVDELKAQLGLMVASQSRLASELKAANEKMAADLAAQQKSVTGPLGDVGRTVDDLTARVAGLQTTLDTMRKADEKTGTNAEDATRQLRQLTQLMTQRMDELQARLEKPLSMTPIAGPDTAFAAASLRLAEGRTKDAVDAFTALSENYQDSPYAPLAMLEAGNIYAENTQPEDAIKIYDHIMERWGSSPVSAEAQFRKADALATLDRPGAKSDAVREYENFIAQYPKHVKANEASARAKKLRQ